MSDYLSQLNSAINAVHIHSATLFSWFGKPSPRLIPRIERRISPAAARSFLQYSLQSRLYSHFYSKGWATPAHDDEARHRLTGDSSFIARLSEANAGQGSWVDGWEQVAHDDLPPGPIAARRGGLLLLAGDGEYKQGAAGHTLQLRFGKELPAESPGFYMAVGDLDLDTPPPAPAGPTESGADNGLVRFYWHLTPDGAVELVRLCTLALNTARVPFKLKVLNDPAHYARCDSAVLYIQKRYYLQVLDLLDKLYPDLRTDLHTAVPAFTYRLAAGLGLAEDPGGGGSFGLHRCGLVADGLIRAYESGDLSPESRLQSVIASFNEASVSLDHPYLLQNGGWSINAGHPPTYVVRSTHCVFPSPADAAIAPASPDNVLSQDETSTITAETALAAAEGIASKLISDAAWHDDMCNWMGTDLKIEGTGAAAGSRREEWATLGPDLYTGTAGVGLFLAEYAALTGDPTARKTALAAFRHAFHKADSLPPSARPGLYTGWVGIALAAERASRTLSAPDLSERASDLMLRCASDTHPGHEHDLLAGSAGAIIGGLALHTLTAQSYLLDYAVRLGDDLLSAAIRGRDDFLCWKSVNTRTAAPLTGFSHGVAGIAHALLELWRSTSDSRFREAADAAFRYEERYFNPHAKNWPDFRETAPPRSPQSSSTSSPSHNPLPYATYWCHGAPGIALSRLRAHTLTRDSHRLAEAQTALRTTERALAAELVNPSGNYSLCHGLAGNATILQHGSSLLDPTERTNHSELISRVATAGIAAYKANGWWPCGTGTSPSNYAPGLFLGTAGIGHFYLRLANPEIPSVLLVEPGSF